PTRARRKWLRWLALPAAAPVLALAYQLTRPPELVWSGSKLIGRTGRRFKLQVPQGWALDDAIVRDGKEDQGYWLSADITFRPHDNRPWLLKRVSNYRHEAKAELIIEAFAGASFEAGEGMRDYDGVYTNERFRGPLSAHSAVHGVRRADLK